MKKFALALMASAAAVFGFGVVASAQSYSQSVTVTPSSTGPGGAFTAVYENCEGDEDVTFNVPGATPETVVGSCDGGVVTLQLSLLAQTPNLGSATGAFTAAPTAPGTYPGTATPTTSPALNFQIVVVGQTSPPTPDPGTDLPATGSDGIGTTTMIAVGLLVLGGGLFAVAQFRRRDDHAAA